LQVKGIGPKKLEALRPFLRVEAPAEIPVQTRVENGGPAAEKNEIPAAPAEIPPKSP
jgi:hypothetical protein